MSGRFDEKIPTTPDEIFERMGGYCMFNAQQAAERHFLGEVVTGDIVEYYEYPLRAPQLASEDGDIFQLRMCYLLARLSHQLITARQREYSVDFWQPDDFSRCRRFGVVQPPITRVAWSGADAIKGLPGKLKPPLLLSTYNERSGEGHVWFASDDEVLEEGKEHHLLKRNAHADNVYGTELFLAAQG